MEINEERLQNLLADKKKHIKTKTYMIEAILSLVSFLISLTLSKFWETEPVIRFVIIGFSLVYLILFCVCIYGSNYSIDALYKDICSSSEIHNFSLIIIKNNKGEFLLKYNKRWRCFLFPFSKTKENDKDSIIDFCKQTLNMNQINIIKCTDAMITKRSVSANLLKNYHHTFYLIECTDNLNQNSTFRINKEKYKWYSIEEMKTNKNIYGKNSETINYVDKTF